MKLLTILVVLLVGATPASARNALNWQCGKVHVDMYWYYHGEETEKSFDINIMGTHSSEVNFKWKPAPVEGSGKAYLNGKRCVEIPYDPNAQDKDKASEVK